MNLWMTRVFPGKIGRREEFLEKEIIAVHWKIADLTGCKTKMKIIKNEITSDNPDRRLQAAIAVMELQYKRQTLK